MYKQDTQERVSKGIDHPKACCVCLKSVQRITDSDGFVLPLVLILVVVVTFALLTLFTRTVELRERQALAFAEADLEALTKSGVAFAFWIPNCKTVWGYRSAEVSDVLVDLHTTHEYSVFFPHDDGNSTIAEPFVLDLKGIDRVKFKVADGSDIPHSDFDLKLYYCWGEEPSASCLNGSSSGFINLVDLAHANDNNLSSLTFELEKTDPIGKDFLALYLEASNYNYKIITTPEGEEIVQPIPQHFRIVFEVVFNPCAFYPGKGYTETNVFLANKSWPAGIDRYVTTKQITELSIKDFPEEPWDNEDAFLTVLSCPGGICKTRAVGDKMTIEALKLSLTLPDLPLTPLPARYQEVQRTYSLRRSYTNRSLADPLDANPSDRLDCWIRIDFKVGQGKSGPPCEWIDPEK